MFSTKKPKRILFLASGRGSNMQAVLEFLKENPKLGKGVGLLSDNPEAKALSIARDFGLEAIAIPFSHYSNKSRYHEDLLEKAKEFDPELVIACGYMRILKPDFVKTFPQKIINIHPSLLPSFPGLDAQKQALEYGAKVSGCTVHFVEEGVDTGPIILQKAVAITENMTEKELSLRILQEEHKILKEAVKAFCEDKLKIEGRTVRNRI